MNMIMWLVGRLQISILTLLLTVACVLPAWSANTCLTNFIVDGSFPDSSAPFTTSWVQSSKNFGTPLCDIPKCGTSFAPNSPSWGAWFGGAGGASVEIASLEQNITVPTGIAQMQFYIWNKTWSVSDPDFVRVRLDGTELFLSLATDVLYQAGYTQVALDLSAYADGKSHILRFESMSNSADIFVDDIIRAPNEIFINYDPVAKKILHKGDLLQPVIDVALLTQEIRSQAFTGSEDIAVNLQNANGVLTLRGGFNCDLGNNTGGQTAVRSLTVNSGNVIAENIVTRTTVTALFPGLLLKSGKFVAKNVVLRQI